MSAGPERQHRCEAGPRGRGGVWLALLAASLIVLLIPMPQTSRLIRSLTDMGHGPFFAALAAAAWAWRTQFGPLRHPARFGLALWGGLVILGVAIELAQGAVGRQPSRQDALANALGAAAGVLWMAATPHGSSARRRLLLGSAALCLGLSVARPLVVLADIAWQRRQMPILASFECSLEMSRWSAQECAMRRVRSHATDGRWSLRLDLRGGRYPGATMGEPTPNWERYRFLAFDVTLQGADALDFVLKVADTPHNWEREDRFERRLRLARGRQLVRVPLAEIRSAPAWRAMDLRQVTMVQFFAVNPPRPVRVYLDNLRLE
jgi:hypothetical protein